MSTIFSKIVSGEIPCHQVWEDEEHLAFLDIQPLSEGHTLVIPKREEDYLFDLTPRRSQALWAAAHRVADLLKSKLSCTRVAVLVLGYEVAHAHIHLIPSHSEGAVLSPQRQPTDHAALAQLASYLRGEHLEPVVMTTIDVEARWDEFAHRFVAQVEEISLRAARTAIDTLQLSESKHVLEVGCGGGAAGLELRRRLDQIAPSSELTLTDISQEMISITQEKVNAFSAHSSSLLPVKVLRADAQQLPFHDQSFNRYLSCLNLMLVPDHISALREAYRVLEPNGLAAWVVWGRPEHSPMMSILPDALQALGLTAQQPASKSLFHLGGSDTFKDLLTAEGFKHVRCWYQQMAMDCELGEHFTEMIFKLRPELYELAGTRLDELTQKISTLAQAYLDRGEPIGLDTLIVVARKP